MNSVHRIFLIDFLLSNIVGSIATIGTDLVDGRRDVPVPTTVSVLATETEDAHRRYSGLQD
jgi:hypothetical protein